MDINLFLAFYAISLCCHLILRFIFLEKFGVFICIVQGKVRSCAPIRVLDNFNKPYSEPGVEITNGRLLINTSENAPYSVKLRLVYTVDVYSNDNPPVLQRKQLIDLKYEGEDKVVKFNAASTPYTFFITNTGPDAKCISDCGSPGTSDCIANCKEVINVTLPSR